MSVTYAASTGIFTIHTDNTTYQMKVDSLGYLLHLYYGKKTEGRMDYLLTYADRGFSPNPYEVQSERLYSLDTLPQEIPCAGNGGYRAPAVIIQNPDSSVCCDFRYVSHTISSGKYALQGLPAVYANEEEAQTLEIVLRDAVSDVQLHLLYGVLPKYDIITRSLRIENRGDEPVYLYKVQSACLDMVHGDFDLLTFHGRHCMERNLERTPVGHNMQAVGSRRGMSSHQFNPLVILADRDTTETAGRCWSMQFVYSGGFRAEAGKDQFGGTRLQMGLSEERFHYPVKPGQTFTAPEVIMSYSSCGLARLSQNLHGCIRHHVCRGPMKTQTRPVLINSWEAAYFDFTGSTIYNLAKEAHDLGIEMVVMDDGWFGKRDTDSSGLGDWTVNEEKLGESLGSLVGRINDLGMKFGIWVEPEMISEDSHLYREHPDWAMVIPGRKPLIGRSQLVLDFARKEVVDAIFEQICNVLDQANIEYVKWDYNRCIADVYSAATDDQGTVLYDYILGLYDFLERLHQRYPHVMIEGCSGGGGRFDAGMLYYTPQIWCSDNSDAIDRLRIQYGTSFGYPISAVGSHVSICPNEQNGRITPFKTRGIVAMYGSFGYELDPARLTDAEREEIRQQVREFKEIAPLIHNGLYYRLTSPFDSPVAAWASVSEDQKEVLLNAVQLEIHGNMPVTYVRLQGLKSGAIYENIVTGDRYASDALMDTGLPIPVEYREYYSYRYRLRLCEEA